jgi:starch synthase
MGITYADVITTVSPRYAQEITEKEYGYQLHEILGRRQNDLVGIVNGLDENEWTPAFDSYIPSTYSLKNLAGKKECRAALLDECWLEASDSTAIVAMISPLTEMKGIELVKQAIPQFASMNIRFILLGMGNRRQYDEIDALHAQYEDSFHSIIRRDRRMSHLIMAGADILLKPSKSEPGGLDQLIAMAYGTIPVVHDTGGLAETVIDVDDDPTNGSGFVFKEYTVESMIAAVRRSIEYLGTTEWQNLMKHDMSLDFSWRNSADQYVELYNTKLFSAGRDTSTSPTAM